MRKPIIASYALVVLLIIFSLIQKNTEFLIYGAIVLPIVALIHYTDKRFHYLPIALWGFALWIALHSIGGLASIGATRVYDFVLINLVAAPYSILKYDQIIHVYTYVIMALLVGSVVSSIAQKGAHKWTVLAVIVLAASGIGAINEIIEFLPVILFDSPGPGGYTNTALDICANFIGSIIGGWLYLRKK